MSEQVSLQDTAVEDRPTSAELPVGAQLRAARESSGLQVSDISQALKLGPRQVEALEAGDWDGLPGQTFIRGFVRNYARLMQIDSAPLMQQLDRTLEKPADNLATDNEAPATMPQVGNPGFLSRRDRHFMLLGVGLVALAALAYFLMPSDLSALRGNIQSLLDSVSRQEAPAAPPAAAPATSEPVFPPGETQQQVMYPQALTPAEPAAPVPVTASPAVSPAASEAVPKAEPAPATASEPVANTPQMRFLFDKESWIEVKDRNNKVIFSQRLSAGTEQVLSGQGPLSLTIGYAPGVRLFWHGQAVDLVPHTRGDVAKLVLE